MRIVHIALGKVNPESLNGVSKILHWMATYQVRQGHEVEIWGLVTSMTLTPREREYKLRLFPMTWSRIALSRELKAALNSLDSSTWVQFHSVFTPEFSSIAHLLNKRGLAYGITPHGGYVAQVFAKNPWKKHLYFSLREAMYVRNAAWIQALGPTEVNDFRRIAPGVRVEVIPNAQELYPLHNTAPAADIPRPLIGYCGRLATKTKGLDLLIEGFAAYKAHGGTGALWLIGDGEDRASLEKQAAQSGARASITFFGAKFGQEKLDLVASVDAFIHSSRWDAMPTACLEAASLGRPLLLSPHMNLARYVERNDAGLLLDEVSAEGVRRALDLVQQLYEQDQLQFMGDRARQFIKREFNWEENARAFVAAIVATGIRAE